MISLKVVATNEEQLEGYFSQFGKIRTCKIICKHDSQVSRGFGFVIFTTREAAERVIEHRDEHYINGKWVDCKSAILRQEMNPADVMPLHPGRTPNQKTEEESWFRKEQLAWYGEKLRG